MTAAKNSMARVSIMAGIRLVVSFVLAASFFLQGTLIVSGAEKPERLTSATYCSDAWVVNFWNSEDDGLEDELAQIKKDGFNSIILAVPWREFQPGINPVSYNSYAWEKLDRIMAAAASQDLWVVLRVGYTWDFYGEGNVLERFEALLYTDGKALDAWLQYAGKLYQEVSRYPNYYGGFLTWEDFWNFTKTAGAAGHGRASVQLAQKIGYQEYLKKNFTLEEVRELYQKSFTSFQDIYLPQRSEHAYLLFFQFYDDFLIDLLVQTQAVYPDLSMEVRLDVDPVVSADGQSKIGVPHYKTFACGASSFTAAMYGVSMGHTFGTALEAAETVASFKHELETMRINNGGKPIYLDQFLYMDTTEEFAHNAQLKPEERAKFLLMSAPALRTETMGYGIWTYRNYTNNAVYNGQFALGSDGWKLESGSQVEKRNGSMAARLTSAKSTLSQDVSAHLHGGEVKVRFSAESERPVDITVSLGGVSKMMMLDGKRQYELNFGKISGGTIRFQTSGEAWIDNVNVYTYLQDGQLYGLDGEELSCLRAMRGLNAFMR